MPNRILRDWTDSLRLDGISPEGERLFTRLIMKADDYGRFHADPRLVRAACFPLSDTLRTNDLIRWLDELSTRQLILRYETQSRPLLAIINFGQRLKQSRAKFPPPEGKPGDFLPVSAGFPELPGTSRNFPLETKRRESETESDSEPARDDAPELGKFVQLCARHSVPEWYATEKFTLWEAKQWAHKGTPYAWKKTVPLVARDYVNDGRPTRDPVGKPASDPEGWREWLDSKGLDYSAFATAPPNRKEVFAKR